MSQYSIAWHSAKNEAHKAMNPQPSFPLLEQGGWCIKWNYSMGTFIMQNTNVMLNASSVLSNIKRIQEMQYYIMLEMIYNKN